MKNIKRPALEKNPQKKGVCLKVYTMTPKKPNSALRKVARIRLSNGKKIIVGIPGEKHTLQEHSTILIHGGRLQDVPGVRYKVIRGKLDCNNPPRNQSRSKYGVKKIDFSN